jgi:hypothetical protein
VGLQFFLTAYDPSDLPGNSIDPLGFERGYLFLADKLVPGLTNVADRPRYFSLLCLGASLAGHDGRGTRMEIRRTREDAILRAERLWAVGCVLAFRRVSSELREHGVDGRKTASAATSFDLSGLRGVRYAERRADDVLANGLAHTDSEYKLLLSQARYGVLGIYGVVANSLRLWDRTHAELTPDLGCALAEAFRKETRVPGDVEHAIRSGSSVAVNSLVEWSRRSHISAPFGRREAEVLADALCFDPVRDRMAMLLETFPAAEGEAELARLGRIRSSIPAGSHDLDLAEAMDAILAYERAYRHVMLAFERVLWLCRGASGGYLDLKDLAADPVLGRVADELPGSLGQYLYALERGSTAAFRDGLSRLDDTVGLSRRLFDGPKDPLDIVRTILLRHEDVQHGKFDQGRCKSPWVELREGRVSLSMARVPGLDSEPTSADQIAPHPYRLAAMDALVRARGAR